jgi:hypothetical protein
LLIRLLIGDCCLLICLRLGNCVQHGALTDKSNNQESNNQQRITNQRSLINNSVSFSSCRFNRQGLRLMADTTLPAPAAPPASRPDPELPVGDVLVADGG